MNYVIIMIMGAVIIWQMKTFRLIYQRYVYTEAFATTLMNAPLVMAIMRRCEQQLRLVPAQNYYAFINHTRQQATMNYVCPLTAK